MGDRPWKVFPTMANTDGFMIDGVFIPACKRVKMTVPEIEATLTELGVVNDARVGQNPFLGVIEADIEENGWQEGRGPTPWMEEGRKHPGDGSGRLTALVRAYRKHPDKFKGTKVSIDVYPPLNDEQRHKLINRAISTTAPFGEKEYYKLSMNNWIHNPDDSYIEHIKRNGIEFAMLFFTPFPESCLVREKNSKGETISVKLKPGVKDEDAWGKNKTGKSQKQQPAQYGKWLAECHPRAREAFFAQYGEDKEHSITGLEAKQAAADWAEDKKRWSELKGPPISFEELAEKYPESALVNGVLGTRLREGKNIAPGRDAGKGRMTSKEVGSLSTTLEACDDAAGMLLSRVERTAGHTSEANLRDLEAIFKAYNELSTLDFSEGPNLPVVLKRAKELQLVVKNAKARIHATATAEAEAARLKLIELEKQRNQKS